MNGTAAQNAAKEALEESGFEVEPLKLAAVWDRTKQSNAPRVFSCCKLFFVCALIGGRRATSHETLEVGWFHETEIPADLDRSQARAGVRASLKSLAHDFGEDSPMTPSKAITFGRQSPSN